jgi:hypothetical protein
MFKKVVGSSTGCYRGWSAGGIVFSLSEAMFTKNLLNCITFFGCKIDNFPGFLSYLIDIHRAGLKKSFMFLNISVVSGRKGGGVFNGGLNLVVT